MSADTQTAEIYDADYYLRGVETHKSNYQDYRWIPELTIPMAHVAKRVLGYRDGESVVDFGAARGFFVKALRKFGLDARGVDISHWAVENCDPAVKEFMSNDTILSPACCDHIWCKDVLEHIDLDDLCMTLPMLAASARKSLFFIVPLTESRGGEFLCPHDEQDPTHVNRFHLKEWLSIIQSHANDFIVYGSYRIPNMKLVSERFPFSTAFIHAKRY